MAKTQKATIVGDLFRVPKGKVKKRTQWKRWVAHPELAKCGESRPAHAAADGTEVRFNEPFIVDGEPLMFPRDPNGSIENIINCHCEMQIFWKEEEVEPEEPNISDVSDDEVVSILETLLLH